MGRRCFLVSRPLESFLASSTSEKTNVTEWRSIGNGEEVSKELPFLEHWALCILPSERKVKISDPSAREAFLNADYFDLNVLPGSTFRIVSQSDSYTNFIHSTTKWRPAAVMDISAVLEIGETARPDDWILEQARFLVRNWGTYRPFLWNCQHFALFIAQITVATEELTSLLRSIMSARYKFVGDIRTNRHLGHMAGMGASAFIPVVGMGIGVCFWLSAGICMFTDFVKDGQIGLTLEKFCEKYEQLRQLYGF